jgi:hypothetical protein
MLIEGPGCQLDRCIHNSHIPRPFITWSLFPFGGACLLTIAVCVFFMPETRGKALEDIDASFRRKGSDGFENDKKTFDAPLG